MLSYTYDYDVAFFTSCLWKFCSYKTSCLFPGDLVSTIRKRDLLLYLLKSGADTTAKDQLGRACLHKALNDDISIMWLPMLKEVVSILVAAGADVSAVDHDGWSISDEVWRYNLEEFWIGVLEELGYDPADVMQFNDNKLKPCHQLWNKDDLVWKDTPWMERRFMSRAFEYRKTKTSLQEYLQKDGFNFQRRKTEIEDEIFAYWHDLEEDSDSDYEDWNAEDEWKNDYEADEKYTCTEGWSYYQHPLPKSYPNRHVERERLGIPEPEESDCHCDFCRHYHFYPEHYSPR